MEIKSHRKTLRNCAFIAVVLVTFLYILVVVECFLVCQTEAIIGPHDDLDMALVFAKQHSLGVAVSQYFLIS